VWCTGFVFGGPAIARADELDDYVHAQMVKFHIPGMSVGVVKNAKLVVARGYGMANVELSSPATPATVYEIGSMTKQITAVAAMMLVEEGKIGLDSPIGSYLDGLPAAWNAVTVRQLLTQTSGIPDYITTANAIDMFRRAHKQREIVEIAAAAPMNFAPGVQWQYSNTNYYLLGMLIEKAAGMTYWGFLEARIFKPLGMSATRPADPEKIVTNRASGYLFQFYLQNTPPMEPSGIFSAGALLSTVGDLAIWDSALYTETLLKRASLEQMWTPARLKSGARTFYGFGWGLGKWNGHRDVAHGGEAIGFSCFMSRFPDDHLTVIVLTNITGLNAITITRKIAGMYEKTLRQ
jgi:CubicO group peptidase (beta-lactamase class C family)